MKKRSAQKMDMVRLSLKKLTKGEVKSVRLQPQKYLHA
jgi:DNA-binding Xre family transcriptional regulator